MNAPAKLPKLLKVIKVGNSLGVILPKNVLAKLGVSDPGDLIDIVNLPDDSLGIRRHDAGFAEQMEAARAVMKRRRNALSELAK